MQLKLSELNHFGPKNKNKAKKKWRKVLFSTFTIRKNKSIN